MNKLIDNSNFSPIKYSFLKFLGNLLCLIIIESLISLTFSLILELIGYDTTKPTIIMNFIFVISTIITIYIWIILIEKRSFRTIGFEKENIFKKYKDGYIVATITIIICCLPVIIIFNEGNYLLSYDNTSFTNIFIYFIFFIIQGSSEEILVRGYIMPTIGKKYGMLISIIVSSLIFALLHIFNPNIQILPLINLFLAGIVFGIIAYYYESLWIACAAHSAWNFIQGPIFGIKVSGQEFGKTLFTANLKGPEYLTGGNFGIEGSLITTLVAIIIILIYVKKSIEK